MSSYPATRAYAVIADMRADTGTTNNETVQVLGYWAAGDGGGGEFYWNATSTTTEDGGLVIGNMTTGRWLRVFTGYLQAQWFGSKECTDADTTIITANTAAVQAAVNALNTLSTTDGGTIRVTQGHKFKLKTLTLYAKQYIEFYASDDESGYSGSRLNANEKFIFGANSVTVPGSVAVDNEMHYAAPHDPGFIVHVLSSSRQQESYYGLGQNTFNPKRAAMGIWDDMVPQVILGYERDRDNFNYENTGYKIQPYVPNIIFSNIGSANFLGTPAIAVGDTILGVTSGAIGFVASFTSSKLTVYWSQGRFQSGEFLKRNGTDTSTIATTGVDFQYQPGNLFKNNPRNGYWGVGILVPNTPLAVGGGISIAPTRTYGQFLTETITNPFLRIVNSEETTPTNGFYITYDPSQTVSRLVLKDYTNTNVIGLVGGVSAYLRVGTSIFTSIGVEFTIPSNVAHYNIAGVTKNAIGDYSIRFNAAYLNNTYPANVTIEDPLIQPYIYVRTNNILRVRFTDNGTTNLIDPTIFNVSVVSNGQ